ncbi:MULTISPECIES: hypothetical protein [Acidobacteriaceae]|uniref:hypothetical protein n=1 Tax=Acidobacteriaceae TaxID=204434 RepID=UPI00131C2E73|nr:MULTISPECIES: hypothetical protein [Acidobacteriaceae]MDW5267525.1 hypothetical protein [Edaphobacter sp.]
MNYLAVLFFLSATILSFGQAPAPDGTKGIPITFHATSVRQEDSTNCDPDKCSTKKFTIEGYTDGAHKNSRVSYVLTCDETVAYKPTPHVAMACARVHANDDYAAKIFSDSISFWPAEKYTPPPYRALFTILSETEVSKPNK